MKENCQRAGDRLLQTIKNKSKDQRGIYAVSRPPDLQTQPNHKCEQ